MSITIINITNTLFDDGSIKKWKQEHPYHASYNSLQEVPIKQDKGLFLPSSGIIVHVEKVLAGDIRKINKETTEDILVLSSKKSNANFSKDNIKVIDLIPPTNERKLIDFISSRVDVSEKIIRQCIRSSNSPESAFILARQAFLIQDGTIPWSYVIDPLRGDELPWNMFNAIISGHTNIAVEETQKLIQSGIEPVQLMFQIVGYFKKVLMVKDDQGELLKNNNTQWFRKIFNNIKDEYGLLQDINYYHDIILKAPKYSHHTILSFVSSLSTRFER